MLINWPHFHDTHAPMPKILEPPPLSPSSQLVIESSGHHTYNHQVQPTFPLCQMPQMLVSFSFFPSKTSQVRQSPFTKSLIPLQLKLAPNFPPILPQSKNPYLQIQCFVYAIFRKCCYSSLVGLGGGVIAICLCFPCCV